MKKLLFILISVLTLSVFTSCDKSTDENLSNENLIEEISTSYDKQNIEPTALPETTQAFLADEHFETYVETVAYVDGKGYEVTLATEDVEYFDRAGDVLRHRDRPRGCHRPGRCGGGERIGIDALPDVVVEYINANYPDQEIRRAKIKGDFYLVAITGPTILIFDGDGAFVNEAPLIRFCFGHRILLVDLHESIVTYITENYPEAEIKVAFKVHGKIVVGVLTPAGRKILVFTLDGAFLFERP